MTSARSSVPVVGSTPACHDCPPGCSFLDGLRGAFRCWERDFPGQRPRELAVATQMQFSERHFRRLLRQHGLPLWRTARLLMAENMAETMAADVRSPGQAPWEANTNGQGNGVGRRSTSPTTSKSKFPDRGRDVNAAICGAIGRRRVIKFWYDDSRRTVEPHCHGVSTAGNEVLRAFQTAGFSQSGTPVAWKLFEVSKITSLRETGAVFATNRPGYRPTDRAMAHVHCHV